MYEYGDMTAQSLYKDMVIGTLGVATNLDELLKNGVVWKRGKSVLEYVSVDSKVIRKLFQKRF